MADRGYWFTMSIRLVLTCRAMLIVLGAANAATAQEPLADRWVFSFSYGRSDKDVKRIKDLVDTAAAHGLNGLVLSSFGVDGITRWPKEDVARLRALAAYCRERNIELIPTGLSVGYGGGALGHDRSFAAALPTTIRLIARHGRLVPDPGDNLLVNGDLEDHHADRFTGYRFHDRPGEVSFVDANAASGAACIRFENFGKHEHGNARIAQTAKLEPGYSYRLTFRLKTENLQPVSGLKAMFLADGRSLTDLHPRVEPTQDWTTITLDHVQADANAVTVYVGMWAGQSGRFWVDDLQLRRASDLSDIVRREGTPLALRSMDREVTFVEGRDFAPIRCLRRSEPVKLPAGSTIREGESLELDCYKVPSVSHSWGEQISLCMSNPALYDYWREQLQALYRVVPFKRFLLSMDEIRNGGGCRTCRERGLSMAEILGDCITRQHDMLRALDPNMQVLIWSDMLDPAHNAHNHYYGIVGDFTGSWRHVPRDLTIMCWYHKIREPSLAFFSEHGFATMGAAYYDADDLTGSRQWLESLRRTPGAKGILYTTWERKYDLLGAFGDMVSGQQR